LAQVLRPKRCTSNRPPRIRGSPHKTGMGAQCVTERCEPSMCMGEHQEDAVTTAVQVAQDGFVFIDEHGIAPRQAPNRDQQASPAQPPTLLVGAGRWKPTMEASAKKPDQDMILTSAAPEALWSGHAEEAVPLEDEDVEEPATPPEAEEKAVEEPQPLGAAQVGADGAAGDGDTAAVTQCAEPMCSRTQGRAFILTIDKKDGNEKLGLDVRHDEGTLEVTAIFADGAIARTNKIARSRCPPDEVLRLGDVIRRVNDVEGDDTAMVDECVKRPTIKLLVERYDEEHALPQHFLQGHAQRLGLPLGKATA